MSGNDEKGPEHAQVMPASVARVHPIPGSSSSTDPAGIRAVMAQTRAEMSVTIDALQERLDPERLKAEATTKARETAHRLKDQATEKVRDATIGRLEGKVGEILNKAEDTAYETRYGIADAIRQNPIPAALIGVGLAWMFFSGSDRNGRSNRPYGRYATDRRAPGLPLYGRIHAPPVRSASLGGSSVQDTAEHVAGQAGARVQQVGQRVQQVGSQAQDQVENLTGQVKGTVQQLGDKAQDQVESLTGQVKETAQQIGSQAQDQVEQLTGQVTGTAQQIGSQAQHQVGQLRGTFEQFGNQAQDQFDELQSRARGQVQSLTTEVQLQAERLSGSFNWMFRENPLALGAVAIALGATAAMIAPRTPQEDQLFGDAREQVVQKAQVAAHEALDQAQKAVDLAQQSSSAPPR